MFMEQLLNAELDLRQRIMSLMSCRMRRISVVLTATVALAAAAAPTDAAADGYYGHRPYGGYHGGYYRHGLYGYHGGYYGHPLYGGYGGYGDGYGGYGYGGYGDGYAIQATAFMPGYVARDTGACSPHHRSVAGGVGGGKLPINAPSLPPSVAERARGRRWQSGAHHRRACTGAAQIFGTEHAVKGRKKPDF
jgi:hypothetical protein